MKSSDFFLKSVMKRFSSNGEGIIDIFLLSKKIFNRYQYICLPILNFPLTRGGHLVLNIRFWSTDSYSKTVTPTKVFAPSVLNRLVWRRKTLTAFSHNFSWGQIFLHLCLGRWNQTCSCITEPKQLLRL